MPLLPNPSENLERAFREIETSRMKGLPFLNPALKVEAVGFREWDAYWLGVLVTPWAINLLLTPRDSEKWTAAQKGEKLRFGFPYGDYDFIVAHEALLGEGIEGDYMMSALFSPAPDFSDHETAHATAVEIMNLLFTEDAQLKEEDALPPKKKEEPLPTLSEKLQKPMSKRDFLRGGFLRK